MCLVQMLAARDSTGGVRASEGSAHVFVGRPWVQGRDRELGNGSGRGLGGAAEEGAAMARPPTGAVPCRCIRYTHVCTRTGPRVQPQAPRPTTDHKMSPELN